MVVQFSYNVINVDYKNYCSSSFNRMCRISAHLYGLVQVVNRLDEFTRDPELKSL